MKQSFHISCFEPNIISRLHKSPQWLLLLLLLLLLIPPCRLYPLLSLWTAILSTICHWIFHKSCWQMRRSLDFCRLIEPTDSSSWLFSFLFVFFFFFSSWLSNGLSLRRFCSVIVIVETRLTVPSLAVRNVVLFLFLWNLMVSLLLLLLLLLLCG